MNRAKVSGIGVVVFAFSGAVLAECSISEESKALDPVEAGFCESDTVRKVRIERSIFALKSAL
jgi:hypothetical protein